MKFALVFPGQGAQSVGMGKPLCEASPAAREVFAEADEALGFSLSDIIFHGPEEKLTLTAYTQPAILTMCVAVMRAVAEKGISLLPFFVAGHSLGEYTALVANKVLSLADAVRLVHKRGAYMQEAVPEGVGAMAAILGLDQDAVHNVCTEACLPGEVCEAVNYNTPVQTVISGHAASVKRAVEVAAAKGARRSVMLKVSAPFHSSLMKPAADRLKLDFEQCLWHEPECPLVANVSARSVSDLWSIKEGLYAQTFSPVRWVRSTQFMADQGVDRFIEMGPGKVLSGMIRKIEKGAKTLSVETPADIEKIVPFLEQNPEE